MIEAVADALGCGLARFLSLAFMGGSGGNAPTVNATCFREQVPLPVRMTIPQLERSLNETQRIIHQINANLLASGARILQSYIQGNNFSGLVSNMLCDSLTQFTGYQHNSDQAYPDLITRASGSRKETGLEVKTTINVGKGGESHNGHSGWHLVACFNIDKKSGDILFVHVMLARLNAHNIKNPDWKYLGSRLNPDTGSRRTETFVTNLQGTTKLRDGSVYLDANVVDFSRWRQLPRKKIPTYSIFHDQK